MFLVMFSVIGLLTVQPSEALTDIKPRYLFHSGCKVRCFCPLEVNSSNVLPESILI